MNIGGPANAVGDTANKLYLSLNFITALKTMVAHSD